MTDSRSTENAAPGGTCASACSACGKPATTKAGLCGECDRRAFEGHQRNFIAFMGGLENFYGPEHF